MLNATMIKKLFVALNEELARMEVIGEVGLCGGAVMCLVFQARDATKDVDGIFEPTREIRKACRKVGKKFGLEEDWLNDAAKGYFQSDPPKQSIMGLSNLRVWAPSPDYMLAMKCISARFDTYDQEDVKFLIQFLKLKASNQVFKIISKYYPHQRIPAKAKFLVEEIFGESKNSDTN